MKRRAFQEALAAGFVFALSSQLAVAQGIDRDARQEARQELRQAINTAAPSSAALQPAASTTAQGTVRTTGLRAADLGLWVRAGTGGLTVADVANQGALATAGLLEGDRIISISGHPVTTEAQLVQLLMTPPSANQPLSIVVVRNGQQQALTIQPTALSQGMVASDPFFHAGLLLDDTDTSRLVVQRVFPRTPAFYAGLRPGDVIGTINGQPITNPALLSQALMAGGNVNLQVTRNGQMRDLAFTMGDLSPRTAMVPTGIAAPSMQTTTAGTTTATSPAAIGPIRTTANPPVPPGIPRSPAAMARPTSPSLQVQPFVPGGAPTAIPGARTAVPGAPTAALPSGTLPPTGGLPAAGPASPQNSVVPAFGSPGATGATGTTGGTGSTAGGAGATGGTGANLGGAGSTAGPSGGAAASGT